MSKMTSMAAVTVIAASLFGSAANAADTVRVHKDPNCSCCSGWVRYLETEGFVATIDETTDLEGISKRLGVPSDLAACHTAEVGGYVVEGHVPAAAIRGLLRERPDARGLAVPGMPVGSPGMEGRPAQRYAVVLFGGSGRRTYMQFMASQRVD